MAATEGDRPVVAAEMSRRSSAHFVFSPEEAISMTNETMSSAGAQTDVAVFSASVGFK